jgi:hypothetical protein
VRFRFAARSAGILVVLVGWGPFLWGLGLLGLLLSLGGCGYLVVAVVPSSYCSQNYK